MYPDHILFVYFIMLPMKQLNSNKTHFPRFDKILVIYAVAEMYGVSKERQLCSETGSGYLYLLIRFCKGSRVAQCLTCNPGVLGSSRTGSSGLFRGSVLGQYISEPILVLVKPRKDMDNVNCRHDMTEILLKAA